MPARAVLNAYYAWRVQPMDKKQRDEFDGELYGLAEQNRRADAALENLNAPAGGEG